MLRAYLDASTQKTPNDVATPVICVAGFLSTERKWKQFQHRWRKLLYKSGLEFFHMTDFENYKRNYKDWSRDRHDAFLKEAISVVQNHVSFGFASAVVLNDFALAKQKDNRLQAMSGFTFCIIQCLYAIKDQEDRFSYKGDIDYIFETGDGYDNELKQLEREIEFDTGKRQRFRLGSWVMADKRDELPLQAADICAYENGKEMVNSKIPGERLRKTRISARLLFKGITHDFRHHTPEGLAHLGQPPDGHG